MLLSCISSSTTKHKNHFARCFLFLQEGESSPEQNKRTPSDFLKSVLGRPVNVRLNSGTDYRGESPQVFATFVFFVSHHFLQ
jgi:hypothetical protein